MWAEVRSAGDAHMASLIETIADYPRCASNAANARAMRVGRLAPDSHMVTVEGCTARSRAIAANGSPADWRCLIQYRMSNWGEVVSFLFIE
jgi:hypothetical protein